MLSQAPCSFSTTYVPRPAIHHFLVRVLAAAFPRGTIALRYKRLLRHRYQLNVEKIMLKQLCCLVCRLAITSLSACAQDKASRPSPPANAECKLSGGKSVKI